MLSNFETLLLSATTRTLSCRVHPGAVVLRDRLASPRPNGNRHRKRKQRRSAERRRKFGSSRLNSPKHGPTPPRPLHWQRSASLPDLAGALIDFVHVGIFGVCTGRCKGNLEHFLRVFCRRGCSCYDPATWCIACQSEQGGAQDNSCGVC
jgi:hypothetical protein